MRSQDVSGLRLSLLAALGVLPFACGGSSVSNPEGPSASGTSGTSSDTPGASGKSSGTPNTPGNPGASGTPGMPSGTSVCSAPAVNPSTKLTDCAEGYSRRPSATACTPAGAGEGGATGVDPVPGSSGSTQLDPARPCGATGEDCTQYENGYCRDGFTGGGGAPTVCATGCVTDNDCRPGELCACGQDVSPTGGICLPASCRTDLDCGETSCSPHASPCGWSTVFDCRPAQGYAGGGGLTCGRPFLVEDEQRHAPLCASSAWRGAGPAPALQHLSSEERQAAAAHWARMGQMEHASIAAFARFSLQLLALGAPPELVEACTAALADETAHTRLCFELASAYAGHAIGPGPLDVERSLELTSLEDIVDLVIAEGCFGETGAALEALAAAEAATDPVIRDAYARIATDEQRHAELAFRFVRWALQRSTHTVRPHLLAARRSTLTRHRATLDVVLPCFDALLATVRVAPTQELAS